MRSLQNRSLLEVNEDFGGKRNDKRAFLVALTLIVVHMHFVVLKNPSLDAIPAAQDVFDESLQ